MATVDVAHDTIQSPPPESGEYAAVQIEVAPGAGDHAPHYVKRVVSELHTAVASVTCPEHGAAPALTVDFGTEDVGTVVVIPHDCCTKLDELVARALAGTPVFKVIRPR
jgi:hypothetical protein